MKQNSEQRCLPSGEVRAVSAGSLIRDSLQRELLDTQTDHVEREEINEVSEDGVVAVLDETDL